uniref:Uncharacterized protein n=1 Tax=Amphiprion ocellaris TaxID=80972 RepID=A0AAQ5ZIH8_AMPOC
MKIEQRINIELLANFNSSKNPCRAGCGQGANNVLKTCLSATRGSVRGKRRDNVEDDPKPGCPPITRTDVSIQKVKEPVQRVGVRTILLDRLGVLKIYEKLVLHLFYEGPKTRRVDVSLDVLKQLEGNPKFPHNVITEDETRVFQYDPEIKQQSLQWKMLELPRAWFTSSISQYHGKQQVSSSQILLNYKMILACHLLVLC